MHIDQKPKGGLSSPAEATLFRQAGCHQSLNLLMARHDGLVHQILHRYGLGGVSFSEALLAGRHGLRSALKPTQSLAYPSTWRDSQHRRLFCRSLHPTGVRRLSSLENVSTPLCKDTGHARWAMRKFCFEGSSKMPWKPRSTRGNATPRRSPRVPRRSNRRSPGRSRVIAHHRAAEPAGWG